MSKFILAIDQGTSSTKTLVFDQSGEAIARGAEPLHTSYLNNGYVEQDPEAIYQNVLASVKKCLADFTEQGHAMEEIAAIGIDNQRETFVIWDENGVPLHPAIVWQCKRSISICEEIKTSGLSQSVNEKTGLVIDPYFSATKLIWLAKNNESIRKKICLGEVFFGTIDTWLLYKLTNGNEYATDHTNASRTLLFNLHTLDWDTDLLEKFGLTGLRLPEIKSSSAFYGVTDLGGILGTPLPINALIGDSHSAAFGETCFDQGKAKATLGTGCSIMMNIGSKPVSSAKGMVTTVCWSMEGRIDYALEGVIVSCGATIDWVKNELGLFRESRETESMARNVNDNGGVYFIPAFSGLGSPHWQMERRASISGISFGTTKNHIVRAALESIAYQIRDVISAMEDDAGIKLQELNTHGGISANVFVVQMMADLLNKKVAANSMPDVSALGAALLAGLKAGVYASLDAVRALRFDKRYYSPEESVDVKRGYEGWKSALLRS